MSLEALSIFLLTERRQNREQRRPVLTMLKLFEFSNMSFVIDVTVAAGALSAYAPIERSTVPFKVVSSHRAGVEALLQGRAEANRDVGIRHVELLDDPVLAAETELADQGIRPTVGRSRHGSKKTSSGEGTHHQGADRLQKQRQISEQEGN